ncbi:MAG: hypothetical protein OXC07_13225 [Kistimonas sp.]|nr:hypothetical protein [Kistimonas sp.]
MHGNQVKARELQLPTPPAGGIPGSRHGQCDGRQVKSLAQPQPAHCNNTAADSPFASSAPYKQVALQEPDLNSVVLARPDYPDLSDPNMPINYRAPDFVAPQEQVPRPHATPTLDDDTFLTKTAGEENSLTFIEEQLAERRRVEKDGEEFVFAPLMVTLKNMQTFINHIKAGKQFEAPLTQDEAAALERIGQQTADLVDAEQARYKRSLRLALSLMILCEIITRRQVLGPLLHDNPGLSQYIPGYDEIPHLDNNARRRLLAALPLAEQRGSDGKHALPVFGRFSVLNYALGGALHDQNLLLYPSFHPLTVADFCRFGQLPLHPVGLITDYVMGADSQLQSPLNFARHDLVHMKQLRLVGDPWHQPTSPAECALCSCARRLNWRQLLLDKVPEPVADRLSKPALQLVLFLLFHERHPHSSAKHMRSSLSAFSPLLRHLVEARTAKCDAYEDMYTKITTDQAAMAVLWTIRLWSRWLAADCQLSPQRLLDCAKDFVDKDVPRLEQHLMFFSTHRASLRQLFAQRCIFYSLDEHQAWKLGCPYGPGRDYVNLFVSACPGTGLRNLEHSDLVYFQSLHSPDERHAMEERTRARLPAGTGPEPDTPV